MLCQSERFPPTVLAYNKATADPAAVEQVRRLLVNANQTPAGKPLMMLWSLQGFEDVPADFDAALKAVRAAYPPPK